jgi:hypothetical protein
LREVKLGNQPTVPFGLFDGVEIGALQVLDKRQRQQVPIIELFYDRRYLRPPEARCGAKSPLASYQFELGTGGSNRDGLQEASRAKARLELRQVFLSKLAPRLKRVGANLRDGNGPKR